ncbi:hypothetical protein CryarDRAFT_0717 [Cryptosporangium arvum DSM 44712]|uniref:DUF2252 domain-containing protein n=1 Tax=Cryptosporangium arvum DSM 44712 TaxID=927661 RepID=A0A010ZLY7_9ACTN|nr:hypothetical protein CryarDRAFT_0717 [Cryptosporangium arvum DSM 44712]
MGGLTVVSPVGYELGRNARSRVSRSAQAELADDGRNPLTLLAAADEQRLPELLPLRYERMVASPFSFFRGAATVMAHDLALHPHSGLFVQAGGNAHLQNFGMSGTPDRRLVFDLNDFDETLEAPFEWDLKRLVSSVILAARANRFKNGEATTAAASAAAGYRDAMNDYATQRALEVWYDRIEVDDLAQLLKRGRSSVPTLQAVEKARSRDHISAAAKLTERVNGGWRLREDPPLLTHVTDSSDEGMDEELVRRCIREYRQTLPADRRVLLDRYTFVDFARKVVGVGSVGSRCWVVLLAASPNDPLLLQVKEAGQSVLEWHLTPSPYRNAGQRVVEGQRLIQAAPDVLLGWFRDPAAGHDYYVRQLWDAKGSFDTSTFDAPGLAKYARLCGRVLARAHARSGDPAAIAGYIGQNDRFDRSVVKFGQQYADRTETDYAVLVEAVKSGAMPAPRVPAPPRAEPRPFNGSLRA